ncbi:MAG: 1-acyl-sn-glycerol-3-phosphate acyltransferase [bacterium]|nr:1-acyl-sn-glycerol-3-phosphate acyltransferase [bacterium]
MRTSLFQSKLAQALLEPLSHWGLKWLGPWRFEGSFSPEIKKCVIIGAPHTSNWDFVYMVFAAFVLKQDFRWMGKDAIFRFPFGRLARWAGGISIDRSHSENRVEKTIERFGAEERLMLIIPPEGTRGRRERWKTGFYYIALGAQVPVIPCWVDYANKVIGIGEPMHLSGNLEQDLGRLKDFYRPEWGRHPELFTPPLSEPEPPIKQAP